MDLVKVVAVICATLLPAAAHARSCEPVPGALVVATDGDDGAAGTLAAPLRTVAAAIRRAPPGGTVTVRGGIYRESLPDLTKPLTLSAHACELARLRGSVVVTDWRRDGDGWSAPWPHTFCTDCVDPRNIDPARPHAGLPDQTFVDDVPLVQVAAPADLKPGTFAVADGRLFVGSDPAGTVIEAVRHERALRLLKGSEGSRVAGLTFERYAPTAQPGLGGMVIGDADQLLFENNRFLFSSIKGLSIYGQEATVRGNTFADNGMMGLEAWRADGLLVSRNRFERNNREGFVVTGTVSEAAGAKIVESDTVHVADNRFESNAATGLWLDISVTRANVVRNVARGNARHGVFVELSHDVVVASNRIADNRTSGIAIADSSEVAVWNNAFAANGVAVLVQDDGRVNTDARTLARGATWTSRGHAIHDNAITGPGLALWVRDYAERLRPGEMVRSFSGNRVSEVVPFAEWWDGGKRVFETLAAFRAATGLGGGTAPDVPANVLLALGVEVLEPRNTE